MGAGKSTIGRQLAKELHLEFKDSDKEIEDRAGADIPWIFDVEGEAGFRKREVNVIDDLSQLSNIVLATGGGAITQEQSRKFLQSRGIVVYLQASITQQIQRTAKDRNRPLLQNKNREQVLTDLMEERHPIYESVCDIQIETDRRRPKTVVREIIEKIESQS